MEKKLHILIPGGHSTDNHFIEFKEENGGLVKSALSY